MMIKRVPLVFSLCCALISGLVLLILTTGFAAPLSHNLERLPRPAPKLVPIDIQTRAIRKFGGFGSSDNQFGKLIWVGGLDLVSGHPQFGGLSGLAFLSSDRFVAIGDKGTLFSARLIIEDGKPVGVDEAGFRFLPGLSERQRGWRRDAEGLSVFGNEAYVSFEGETRVMRYAIQDYSFKRVSGRLNLPKDVIKSNRGNKGLEAVAVAPAASDHAGSFVLFTERASKGRVRGWIQTGKRAQLISLPQVEDMLVTDADFTDTGDLLILERSYSLFGGLNVQLRRVRAADLKPGRIDKAEILFRGGMMQEIDNFEGLDVQALPDGSSLVSLISDDNFNAFQRTLLLQFILPVGR